MAFNFLERLGTMLGQRVAEQVLHRPQQTDEQESPPAETPAAEEPPAEAAAAPAEAPPAEPQVVYTVEEVSAAPATAPETTAYAPTGETATVSEPAPSVESYAAPAVESYAAPTAEPAPAAAADPAAPAKSAEELEEERLWAETDAAWAAGDFQKVTESLDALKALQPEDAAEIDEKIAAAQYNQAAASEQAGDLNRALYLYQEAQRRNPNLGEASFAVARIQAALQPPAPPAEAASPAEPEPPAEQTYIVESGDSLWAIAERHYGDGSQWSRIFEANRDQLDNPDVIQPGQTLRIPT